MLCAYTTWICSVFAQCCACALLDFSVLCMCTTEFFRILLIHNRKFQCCAQVQLDFSVLCMLCMITYLLPLSPFGPPLDNLFKLHFFYHIK